jgi:precorrin-6A/cobalt-precorrin-6A reductase
MILLLGGTSETLPIALRLAENGHRVLVSRATEIPLATGSHPRIETRSGPLDEAALAELIGARGIRAIVDATHPYAAVIRTTARRVAARKGIRYLSFIRPAIVEPGALGVELVPHHRAAAAAAFRLGRPVLLTIGTRHLSPYVDEARRTGLCLVARVLDHPQSIEACRRAGIPLEHILSGRGPYSVEENRRHLAAFGIGVLVTKDSGEAGGTREKLEAARVERCRVVVVTRPPLDDREALTSLDALAEALGRS